MAGEAEAVKTLTLLLAVSEQAVARLDDVDPPTDGELIAITTHLSHLIMDELSFGRFAHRPEANA